MIKNENLDAVSIATPPLIIPELAKPYFEQLEYYRCGVQQLWPSLPVRAQLLFTACAGVVELPV